MDINELVNFNPRDQLRFHQELNPELFQDEKLIPEVREQLLLIAQDFMSHLGVHDIDVKDITFIGSNAAFTYTPQSDIDLHIIVDISRLKNDEIYRELFTSKKVIYNDTHDIKIHGYDVELYVQDSARTVKSLGEYSVLNNRWIRFPSKVRSNFDEHATREKFLKLVQLSELALRTHNLDQLDNLLKTVKKYRQAGLDEKGEFSPENLAYKLLRNRGILEKLFNHRDYLHSQTLSLENVHESASGYIPTNDKDPRFKTALTVDIKPDSIQKNAKKLGLGNIKRTGIPQIARSDGKISA